MFKLTISHLPVTELLAGTISEAKGLRWGNRLRRIGAGVVPVANEEFRLWIGCGRYEEYPDGFHCFIEPHATFVRKLLRKIDTRARVAALQRAMDKVLSEADGIREKRWWTYEEFTGCGAWRRAT